MRLNAHNSQYCGTIFKIELGKDRFSWTASVATGPHVEHKSKLVLHSRNSQCVMNTLHITHENFDYFFTIGTLGNNILFVNNPCRFWIIAVCCNHWPVKHRGAIEKSVVFKSTKCKTFAYVFLSKQTKYVCT